MKHLGRFPMANASSIPECCPMQHLMQASPTNEWLPEQLIAYIQAHKQAIDDDERQLASKYWRMGMALNLLRQTFNHGQWEYFLNKMQLEKSKVSRARAIARTFTAEIELAGLTVKQAHERRARKTRNRPLTADGAQSRQPHELSALLNRIIDPAGSLLDEAGFADSRDAAELLAIVNKAIGELEKIRQLLRQQTIQS